MANYFMINNMRSLEFGLIIGGQGTFSSAKRDVTKVSIPGRNGDLIKENGRFLNRNVTYPVLMSKNMFPNISFAEKVDMLTQYLNSFKGYFVLSDTYHPDYFLYASFHDEITFETTAWNKSGIAYITFDCMPQKFLNNGNLVYTMTRPREFTNPTQFDAEPFIVAGGSGRGTITFGNQTIVIDPIDEFIAIDSMYQECFKGTESKNHTVTLNGGFPKFKPGKTNVSFDGGITNLQITPRYFTI